MYNSCILNTCQCLVIYFLNVNPIPVLDEAFYSQSSGRQSSAMMAPNCVDRRVRAGIANMPRMHLAADYRIRNQFSNLKHYTVDQLPSQQFMPTPRPPLKTSHHILTKSNTINNFSEVGQFPWVDIIFTLNYV